MFSCVVVGACETVQKKFSLLYIFEAPQRRDMFFILTGIRELLSGILFKKDTR